MSAANGFEKSKFRIEMDKAYESICFTRQYKGARVSDLLDWLANYIETRETKDAEEITRLRAALESLILATKEVCDRCGSTGMMFNSSWISITDLEDRIKSILKGGADGG